MRQEYGFRVFIKNKNENLIRVFFRFYIHVGESYVKPDNFSELKKSPGFTQGTVLLPDFDKELCRYAVMSPDDEHLSTRQGISRVFDRLFEDLPKFLPIEDSFLGEGSELETIREAYRDFITNDVPETEEFPY